MYIQVRTTDAKQKVTIDISKTCKISELRNLLEPHFNIKPDKQRLFFRGKQLEDEYTIFDYNINLNDMVQIMEKAEAVKEPEVGTSSNAVLAEASSSTKDPSQEHSYGVPVESSDYFQVGEFVDARDMTYGAWFEGKIINIYKDRCYEENKEKYKDDKEGGWPHDGYFYEIGYIDDGEVKASDVLRLVNVRLTTRGKIPFNEVKVGDRLLVNYNIEEPTKRGYWYDAIVTESKSKRKDILLVDLFVGPTTRLQDCKILFMDELYKVGETNPLLERKPNMKDNPEPRSTEIPHDCDHCKNNPRRKCKECGCHVCGLKSDDNMQIMCDECDYAYHIWCLTPPLTKIPDQDEWYCKECKNDENEIVGAGEKLKESKKKAKMASKQNNTTRDWGKGMACVARTKVCTIVPFDHFGPIPGIEVGTLWKFRIQASEAGVHRPHVAGIHGRENIGAFSVVLSGGYEDDIDKGDEVYYTGSGGRDLSGNKRTNAQGFDQTLSRFNKALAMNCNAKLNNKGAEATDWRAGKPVRVIRNYKLAKHSKFAPEEGNRYDGIYKVVKYYPEKGKSGFTVWRYLFRRDDPIPAPWTVEGKKRVESLGLEMQYPDGYLEALAAGKNVQDPDGEAQTPKSKAKGKKRVLEESPNPQPQATTKKSKLVQYTLESDLSVAIQKDTENEKLWEDCKNDLQFGKSKFLAKVEETFTCICCTELVFKPVTTPCHHNICSDCVKRSFKADVMTCPTCRSSLEKDVLKQSNAALQDALLLLFPGYSGSR